MPYFPTPSPNPPPPPQHPTSTPSLPPSIPQTLLLHENRLPKIQSLLTREQRVRPLVLGRSAGLIGAGLQVLAEEAESIQLALQRLLIINAQQIREQRQLSAHSRHLTRLIPLRNAEKGVGATCRILAAAVWLRIELVS